MTNMKELIEEYIRLSREKAVLEKHKETDIVPAFNHLRKTIISMNEEILSLEDKYRKAQIDQLTIEQKKLMIYRQLVKGIGNLFLLSANVMLLKMIFPQQLFWILIAPLVCGAGYFINEIVLVIKSIKREKCQIDHINKKRGTKNITAYLKILTDQLDRKKYSRFSYLNNNKYHLDKTRSEMEIIDQGIAIYDKKIGDHERKILDTIQRSNNNEQGFAYQLSRK